MSDPQSDAEKIRLKRLAKLSQSQPPSQPPSHPPTPKPQIQNVKPQAPSPVSKPSTPTPIPSTSSTPVPTPSPKPPNQPAFKESYEQWESQTISKILGVTFDRQVAEESNWEIVWLKELLGELRDEGLCGSTDTPLLSLDLIDRLLFTRLSLSPDSMSDDAEMIQVFACLPLNSGYTVLDYLGGCWRRARDEARKVGAVKVGKGEEKELEKRKEAVEEVRKLVLRYVELSLEETEMFPQPSDKPLGIEELIPLLISPSSPSPFSPSSLDSSLLIPFITDLLSHNTSSPLYLLPLVLSPADALADRENAKQRKLQAMMRALRGDRGGPEERGKDDIGGDEWRGLVERMGEVVEVKRLAGLIPMSERFNPPLKANEIEEDSALGPLVRLSCFPDRYPWIATQFFPNPEGRSRGDIEAAYLGLRSTLNSIQSSLFNIFDKIIRSTPAKPAEGIVGSREEVIRWWSYIAKANVKRAGMQVDPKTVSSEGFMINLLIILLQFAEPISDATFSKIDKIDPLWFRDSGRLDVSEETRINGTGEEIKSFYSASATTSSTPNFISDIFFLTTYFIHIGVMKSFDTFSYQRRQLSQVKKQFAAAERDRSWIGTPMEARMRANLNKLKEIKERLESNQRVYEAQLFEPKFIGKMLTFYNLAMTWIVRMADPKGLHPKVPIELPLPELAPMQFKMLPEFLIEDIGEYLPYIANYAPKILASQPTNELFTYIIVFLASGPEYIKNPYLRGKLVEVIYLCTRPMPGFNHGPLGDALNYNPMALKHLASGLITIYVDIEHTGSHSQFYDKFNTRYYVSQIFRFMWSSPDHLQALKRETEKEETFIRFINLMMNDTTYVLDESLGQLQEIHRIELKMSDELSWQRMPEEEKKDLQSKLSQAQDRVKGYLDLCIENLHTLGAFTGETKEPFMTPEIVDRLAAMLTYNLDLLAGPRCQDLKVKDPDQYNFKPRELLDYILDVFLNLSKQTRFIEALAKEGRSYSKSLFDRVEGICRRRAIKSEAEIQVLKAMVDKVEELRAAAAADEELGDYPDEYLDPLTYTVMRDPVILPKSRVTIDRSTIKQHLLSDPTDPFNRSPLKIEEVIEDAELKAKIDVYIASRSKKSS